MPQSDFDFVNQDPPASPERHRQRLRDWPSNADSILAELRGIRKHLDEIRHWMYFFGIFAIVAFVLGFLKGCGAI